MLPGEEPGARAGSYCRTRLPISTTDSSPGSETGDGHTYAHACTCACTHMCSSRPKSLQTAQHTYDRDASRDAGHMLGMWHLPPRTRVPASSMRTTTRNWPCSQTPGDWIAATGLWSRGGDQGMHFVGVSS